MFAKVNEDGQTILMVTHSIQAASRAGRIMFIKDGCVFKRLYNEEESLIIKRNRSGVQFRIRFKFYIGNED